MYVRLAVLAASPFAVATVYADSPKEKLTHRVKISQLPVYGEPPAPDLEFIEPKETTFSRNVTLFRKEMFRLSDNYKDTQEMIKQKYEVAKAHTNDLLQYIQEDASVLPRAAIISVAGLGGVVAGYKGGIIRRTFFCGLGMTAAASICYPNQAVDIARLGWGSAKDQTKELWNSGSKTNQKTKEAKQESKPAESAKSAPTEVKQTEAKKDDKPKVDHGMSKAEDKDMYTTRSS